MLSQIVTRDLIAGLVQDIALSSVSKLIPLPAVVKDVAVPMVRKSLKAMLGMIVNRVRGHKPTKREVIETSIYVGTTALVCVAAYYTLFATGTIAMFIKTFGIGFTLWGYYKLYVDLNKNFTKPQLPSTKSEGESK